ncbi:hypothetical protein [Wenjunlia tyrosinilytica]|nr:hypothetical protein [Wenjunlia tyrosinilytica]
MISSDEVPRTRYRIDRLPNGAYQWRLTAQNGRVVAVSATSFAEFDACRDAFAGTRAEAEHLTVAVLHSTVRGGGWVWGARGSQGQLRAVSSRAYERHSTCRAAFERFQVLLSEFDPDSIV